MAPPQASESDALRLVFMGTPAFAETCLARLLETRHEIAAVVTRADAKSGRGKKLRESEVKRLAVENGIEVLQPRTARDPALADRLREIAPDLAVVVAYGRILPREVIDIPRFGCINAHASLLPDLRGAAPIERAILTGLDETGITIMRIDEEMDAGGMMLRRGGVTIDSDTDGGALRVTLAAMAAGMLVEAVDILARGDDEFTEQDHDAATFAPPLKKSEAEIDWTKSAAEVDRQVRAFRPVPGAFTFHGGKRLKILEGRPSDDVRGTGEPGELAEADAEATGIENCIVVRCGPGGYAVTSVQPEGKKPMRAADYLRGSGASLPPRFERQPSGEER